MQMRLPVLALLVELAVDSADYDCTGRSRSEKLVANTMHKLILVEPPDFGFRDYPILMHECDELDVGPTGSALKLKYTCDLAVKPDACTTDA